MSSKRGRTRQGQHEDPTDTQTLLNILAEQQRALNAIVQNLANQPQANSGTGTAAPSTSSSIKHLPIPKLTSPDNLTLPQFRDWKQRWEDYFLAQQLSHSHLGTQHGILRSALDPEWTMLWNSARLDVTTTSTISEIVSQMELYLRKRCNPLLDRQEFHRRDQMAGESVDRYYAALKTLDDVCDHQYIYVCGTCDDAAVTACPTCNAQLDIGNLLKETRIRDRLICGLRDKEMQKRVLSEQYDTTLTLDRVLSICSAVENSNAAGATLGTTERSAGAAAKKSTYKRNQSQSGKEPQFDATKTSACKGCGKSCNNRSSCPAFDKECLFCKRKGHFALVCHERKRQAAAKGNNQLASDKQKNASDSSSLPARSNNTAKVASGHQLLQIPTEIGGKTHFVRWLPDTGAEMDVISREALRQLGPAVVNLMKPETDDVVAANGHSLGPVGNVQATLRFNGRTYTTKIGVFEDVTTPLLSKQGCIALGLIEPGWPISRLQTHSPVLHANSSGTKEVLPTPRRANKMEVRDALITEFPEAFNDAQLRTMTGPPMKIELIPGGTPTKRYKAYTVPFHWRDQVQQQLDDMMTKDIIEPVPVGEPIDWCHPMVVVPKKGTAEPRITVDLSGLNKFVRRPAYPVRVPREVVSRIPPGQSFFTILDSRHGYWQVPLDEESRKLTTFITPWGCFRFRRNVMGLISAGGEHNRRGDEAIRGIPDTEKICEDILIFGTDLNDHTQRVREVIQRCQEAGITLNAKKFQFAESEVVWCGYQLTKHGYTPAPHLVTALKNFPVPTSKTDVRSFLGLVEQFEAFSNRITEFALPLRSLLPSKAAFVWETPHQHAFEKLILELTSGRVLTHFQPGRPLRLETDAAQSKGLGFALWQQEESGLWKLLQIGSRFVTPAESRYSATEVEFLAVVWAVKKCRLFLLGSPFELIVDHRPLIPIINSKTLDEIENPRLQRFKEKLSMYRIHTIWRAGAKHKVVDVFSRFPSSDPDKDDLQFGHDTDPEPLLVAALQDPDSGTQILDDPIIAGIKEAGDLCSEYQRLRGHIINGFPEKSQMDEDLMPFWKVRDGLSLSDDLIILGSRFVIPRSLRPAILKILHASHQGQEKTLRRARQAVFWPNITNDIRNVVRQCQECASLLPSQQREPLQSDSPASYPFETAGADIFSYAGNEYLVLVDRFSGWPLIAKCGTSSNSGIIIHHLKKWMTDFGIVRKLISDNGPQFASLEFRNWTQKWGIKHATSSPHYPQSNGLAESAVKSLKYLLEKSSPNGDLTSDPFQQGLLELRNTPRADGRSPAQLVFGAPIRSTLPLHRSKFAAEWKEKAKEADQKAILLREKVTESYNAAARPLSKLQRGDIVLVQDPRTQRWNTLAEVVDIHGRSFTVKTGSGGVYRRNRRFLRPFNPKDEEDPPPETETVAPAIPRRSSRNRRKPSRFAFFIGCDLGSQLKGGHGVVVTTLPHQLRG